MSHADDHEELDALAARLARLGRPTPEAPAVPPPDLRARTLAAVARDAHGPAAQEGHVTSSSSSTSRPRTRRRFRLPSLRIAVPALAVAAVVIVALVVAPFGGGGSGRPGTLELQTALKGRGGTAAIEVRAIPTGRTVNLDSSSLPILPEGQYYELWFVGPGDSRAKPNRISAGTFHPDEKGESHVLLKAAMNPKKFPTVEITAEPGDGDPRATGPVEARTGR